MTLNLDILVLNTYENIESSSLNQTLKNSDIQLDFNKSLLYLYILLFIYIIYYLYIIIYYLFSPHKVVLGS